MNPKHLAALLLGAVIFGFAHLTLTLKEKWQTAVNAEATASDKLTASSNMRTIVQGGLADMKSKTAASRQFLVQWKPKLEETDSELKAKNVFEATMKRGDIRAIFDKGMNPPSPNKEMTFVSRRVAGRAKFEADYLKVVELLSSIERDLPSSRIASLEIRKGQRANDVEVDLLVEFPIIAAPETAKK